MRFSHTPASPWYSWFLAAALTLVGCGGGDPGGAPPSVTVNTAPSTVPGLPEVAPGSAIAMAVGYIIAIPWAGMNLELVDVQDSRCPSGPDNDIVCVWEGNVVTTFRFHDAGETIDVALEGIREFEQNIYGDSPRVRQGQVEITVTAITDNAVVTVLVDNPS